MDGRGADFRGAAGGAGGVGGAADACMNDQLLALPLPAAGEQRVLQI